MSELKGILSSSIFKSSELSFSHLLISSKVNSPAIIGLFQAFALIPGVSRSGITITGFRIFGYNKYDAIKISLLMSIPTIVLSGFFISPEILEENNISVLAVLVTFILSFFTATIALNLMVKYIYSFGFTPYIYYRIILGLTLLCIAYF